jgi:hypothetical protein
MPLFIPQSEMGHKFSEFLDKYPVTPYLDNRDSFVRWVHFIHNKFNQLLGKEELSLPNALEKYRNEYQPKPIYLTEKIKTRKHIIYASLICILFFFILVFYE